MNKKMIVVFLAGWALAFVLPPQTLFSFGKKSQG